MMTYDNSALGGNKQISITEYTKGKADVTGTFTLSFNGQTTAAIAANADATAMTDKLNAILPAGEFSVNKVDGSNGMKRWE